MSVRSSLALDKLPTDKQSNTFLHGNSHNELG